jgi:hypothetical protein
LHLLNQERNNYAAFVRLCCDLSLPERPEQNADGLTSLLDSLRTEYIQMGHDSILNDSCFLPLDLDDVHPFLVAASELYSSAFFGRQDQHSWLKRFLPVVAGVTSYRKGRQSQHMKKDRAKYEEGINAIFKKLHGKTVSDVLKIVDEALIRLFIVKHILSSVFKKHLDVLILLLRSRTSLAPPDPDAGYQSHFIASITLPPVSRYTSADIAFFVGIRDRIKSTERSEDHKRSIGSDSACMLSFVPPESEVVDSPSRAGMSKRTKVSSPSSRNTNILIGAMPNFSDREDQSDDKDGSSNEDSVTGV